MPFVKRTADFRKNRRREKKEPVWLSPVRRIERVAVKERVCAMTFDDGPCRLPAEPDHFRGKPLTLVLAEILERYGAKGTFPVIGDTSAATRISRESRAPPSGTGWPTTTIPTSARTARAGRSTVRS